MIRRNWWDSSSFQEETNRIPLTAVSFEASSLARYIIWSFIIHWRFSGGKDWNILQANFFFFIVPMPASFISLMELVWAKTLWQSIQFHLVFTLLDQFKHIDGSKRDVFGCWTPLPISWWNSSRNLDVHSFVYREQSVDYNQSCLLARICSPWKYAAHRWL